MYHYNRYTLEIENPKKLWGYVVIMACVHLWFFYNATKRLLHTNLKGLHVEVVEGKRRVAREYTFNHAIKHIKTNFTDIFSLKSQLIIITFSVIVTALVALISIYSR